MESTVYSDTVVRNAEKNCEYRMDDVRCDATMLVQITSFQERVPCGEVLSLFYDQKYRFYGLDQLLLIMEDIMDSVLMPHPTLEHRCLYSKPYTFEKLDADHRIGQLDLEGLGRMPSLSVTFVVRCYHRQHASMQGELLFGRKKEKTRIFFRSTLELIRMVYEYLDREF